MTEEIDLLPESIRPSRDTLDFINALPWAGNIYFPIGPSVDLAAEDAKFIAEAQEPVTAKKLGEIFG